MVLLPAHQKKRVHGSQGILRENGVKVVANDASKQEGAYRVLTQITESRAIAIVVQADVSNEADVTGLLGKTRRRWFGGRNRADLVKNI